VLRKPARTQSPKTLAARQKDKNFTSNMLDKLIGIILIILGPLQIRDTYKNRIKKNDYGASNFKGYMVVFFLIVIGVLLLLGYGSLTEEIINKFK